MGLFNRKKPTTKIEYSTYYDKETNSDVEIYTETKKGKLFSEK